LHRFRSLSGFLLAITSRCDWRVLGVYEQNTGNAEDDDVTITLESLELFARRNRLLRRIRFAYLRPHKWAFEKTVVLYRVACGSGDEWPRNSILLVAESCVVLKDCAHCLLAAYGSYDRTRRVPASAERCVDVEPSPAYDVSDAPHLLTTILPFD
jgi:hypothetical protein